MKTRILKTGIYNSSELLDETPEFRFLIVYLYTNQHIGLSGIYRLHPRITQLETGFDVTVIKLVLDKAQNLGILIHKDYLWIKLLRNDFASLIYSGSSNEIALEKELEDIPLEIRDYFDLDSSVDSSVHTLINHKSKIKNKKPEIKNQKQEQKKFKKPTLEEVQAYCLERKNNLDPQQWLDHYTANGWKVGRNSMKDWKAAVRTWERNRFNNIPKPKNQNTRTVGKYDDIEITQVTLS